MNIIGKCIFVHFTSAVTYIIIIVIRWRTEKGPAKNRSVTTAPVASATLQQRARPKHCFRRTSCGCGEMWGKQKFVEVQFVHYIKIQFCKVVLATNGRPNGLFTLTLNCCAMSPITGSNRAELLSVLGSNYSNKKYQLINH